MKYISVCLLLVFVSGCGASRPSTGVVTSDTPAETEPQAQKEFEIPSEPKEPIRMSKSEKKYEKRVLENGLEVYAIHKEAIPMTTVMIAVKNGAFVETPDIDGLAHLYEHMFFKANEKIPNQGEFLATLDKLAIELGSNMNAYTSTESVRYFFTLQSRYLEEGLEFMANATITPKFLEEELEKERKVVIGEFDRYEASPQQVFFQRDLLGRLFSKHFSRKNTIGSRDVILSANYEQMKTIQERFYVPNNSALFVVGEFDENKIFDQVERYFGVWKRGEDPFKVNPIPDHPPLQETKTFNQEGPVQTVNIAHAYHGPSLNINDKDTIVLDLVSSMLSRQNSPFQKELVDSGLASSAGFFAWTQRYTSPIFFTLETTPEKAQKAYNVLTSLIARLYQGGFFTQEELETAKISTEVTSAYDREVAQRYALGLAAIWTSTGSLDYYTNYIDQVRNVTMADVDAALARYLKLKHYVAGALLPKGAEPVIFRAESKNEKLQDY